MKRRQFLRTASLLTANGLLLRASGGEPAATPASPPPSAPAVRPANFDRVQFHNVEAMFPAEDGDGWRLCRVPRELEAKLNPSARKRAFSTAGCELRFNLVGEEARILLKFASRGAVRWLAVLTDVFGDYQVGSGHRDVDRGADPASVGNAGRPERRARGSTGAWCACCCRCIGCGSVDHRRPRRRAPAKQAALPRLWPVDHERIRGVGTA